MTEHDFCTNCGADVGRYKRIMSTANLYYNEALEKAGVRDLSGAVESLRQCLKLNKNHVEARNLLGLVYFELGEAVAAMSEWVISKNLRPSKNIADDYLDMMQNDPTTLESISQTIKKYNQALTYCYQGSLDLAVIQLKKVISLNPKFVQAHQLLALLYINAEKWNEAKRELEKCRRVDVNNTITLRYLREVNTMLEVESESGMGSGRRKSADSVKYRRGNETIIQPLNSHESKGVTTLLNIILGIVIGVAAACFLILPAQVQNAKQGIDAELKAVNEEMDVKTATIAELEQNIKVLKTENEKLESELIGYTGKDGKLSAVDNLLNAADAYMKNSADTGTVAEYLDMIDEPTVETAGAAFESVYNHLRTQVGTSVGKSYYDTGMEAYQNESYKDAIEYLARAFSYDNTNGEALYNLGNAYRKDGDNANAIATYQQVIELFPNTEKANRSQSFINEITAGTE